MEKLIISNFRKIKDEWEMDFSPTTFLTGTNNSGKSTIIKAILIMNDYLNSENLFELNFNGPNSHHHKISSFNNARSLLNSRKNSPNICFTLKSKGKIISTIFSEHPTSQSKGILNKLRVTYDRYPNDYIEFLNSNNENFSINVNFKNRNIKRFSIQKHTNKIQETLSTIISNLDVSITNFKKKGFDRWKEYVEEEFDVRDYKKVNEHKKLLVQIYKSSSSKEFKIDSNSSQTDSSIL